MSLPNWLSGGFRAAGSVWNQADRALGGWLPGGGVASPLTRAKQEGERRMASQLNAALDRQSAANSYVGQPGRFASQGQGLNALRAITQSGANPFGVIASNPKDIQKVANYYATYPDVQNEYDLNTNMFLRYLSGTGADNLQIPQTVGRQLYQDIQQSKEKFANPAFAQEVFNDPTLPPWYKEKVKQGYTPVYYGASADVGPEVRAQRQVGDASPAEQRPKFKALHPGDIGEQWQLRNSLGSYWVNPSTTHNSYTVENEKYDFGYAPKDKGGQLTHTDFWRRPAMVPTSPDMIGRGIVTQGYGNPYTYSLEVDQTGQVKVK